MSFWNKLVRLGSLAARPASTVVTTSVLIAGTLLVHVNPVSALLGGCSATLTPHSVGAVASNDIFQFQISNTSSQAARWVKFIRPSADFVINGIHNLDLNGVSDTAANDYLILSGSGLNISPGGSLDVQIRASVGINQAAAANWQVQLSDSDSGANPTNCTGTLDTSISGHAVPDEQYSITDERASNITSTSAIITWSSTPTNSIVFYGQNLSYDSSSALDSQILTNHSINLNNLKPNTDYHFQVAGTDADGRPVYSADSTFSTPPSLNEPDTPANINSQPITTPVPIRRSSTDKTPPNISISTKLSNPYKAAPTIEGSASDNTSLATIEYSLDAGKNWLPVDKTIGLGKKMATFSFTPLNLNDGNYQMMARAIDTSGNIGRTVADTIVIDQLPPLTGGSVETVGPQVLEPNSSGTISIPVKMDEKVTLSAIGGPTSITVQGIPVGGSQISKRFSLVKSTDTDLWSGTLNFDEPGSYKLVAHSADGAGNKVDKTLTSIYVAPAGLIVRAGTNKAVSADVTVYYLEPESNEWLVWDGASYNQQNPIATGAKGNFRLLLPAGKYYLEAKASGYRTLTSSSFVLKNPTPISTTLNMKTAGGLKIGPIRIRWPEFSTPTVNMNLAQDQLTKNLALNNLTGQTLPEFSAVDSTGSKVSPLDLLGKPTLITFITTWFPNTNQQLTVLSQLQKTKNINIEIIAPQQRPAEVSVYNDIAGYGLNWLADPESSLSNSLGFSSLPTHYFVDHKGVIKKIVTGVLTKQQLLDNLQNL